MNMKQMVVLMCVASMGAGAFAQTFMGPPTAELQPGEWKAGYSFSFAEMDVAVSSSGLGSDTAEDVEVRRHYFDLGYGLAENFELNVLLGSAGISVDVDGEDGDGSDEFSWGFNTKYTFIDDETIDWGVMYQMTWFSSEYDEAGVEIEIDAYDMQIAVGPTVDMGGWDLYGGAFYYALDGDIEVTGLGSGDFEEEGNFGGFIGAQFEIIPEGIVLACEGQFTGDSWAGGLSVGLKF